MAPRRGSAIRKQGPPPIFTVPGLRQVTTTPCQHCGGHFLHLQCNPKPSGKDRLDIDPPESDN